MDVLIEFNKKSKLLEEEYIPIAVERIINNNSERIIDKHKIHSSFRDLQNKIFGAIVISYKTIPEHKGMIIKYTSPNMLDRYIANIELIGFDPNNRNNKKLREELEFIANKTFSVKELEELAEKYMN